MKVTELIKTKLNSPKLQSIKERIKRKPRVLITAILIILIIFGTYRILSARINRKSIVKVQSQIQKVPLNKSLDFFGLDMNGKSTKFKIKTTFISAETDDKVQVKDQIVQAKEGKLFLLVNLEYGNNSADKLNIIPENLIRLTAENDDKKRAPDLHNNAILVSPDSVKSDRIGFVVDSNIKSFKLLVGDVGELEKKKEVIEIKF